MQLTQRAQKIQLILEQFYPDPAIPLTHYSPYTLLIAVVLSARCTDERVNRITPQLFSLARTPQEMIQLSISTIQDIIRPCGLSPTKAKNIWHLSKQLIDNHNGEVPNSLELLETLPGVGHKTASVVVCQAFNTPAFPIDTHIQRCARRWKLSRNNSLVQIERDLKRLFPQNLWIKIHLQIIHFARAFCPAVKHQAQKCPICSVLGVL